MDQGYKKFTQAGMKVLQECTESQTPSEKEMHFLNSNSVLSVSSHSGEEVLS